MLYRVYCFEGAKVACGVPARFGRAGSFWSAPNYSLGQFAPGKPILSSVPPLELML